MNTLILPGNNPSNADWATRLYEAINPLFSNCYIHAYEHWSTGGPVISFETELKCIAAEYIEVDIDCVVGKSAGAVLALMAINRGIIRPKSALLLGLPVRWAAEHGVVLSALLRDYSVPTFIMQQAADPIAPVADLKQLLTELGGAKTTLEVIEGDDHQYADFKVIRTKLEEVTTK